MSAGHLSRQFKLAYGESPYGYLMTRRIERAMALLRRGDLSVTDVCFAVGCSSLGTFSTRFTELVGVPPSAYRRRGHRRHRGHAAVRGQAGHQTDQESRSAGRRAAPSVTAMDITIHASFLPHDDPDASLAFYRDTLGFEVRNDVGYDGMRWITVGPARPARHVNIVLHPPAADPGITDDERRTITEMMAKGTYAGARPRHQGPRRHVRAAPGQRRRGRPGADRPALRRPRLRRPRPRGQHDPHPGSSATDGTTAHARQHPTVRRHGDDHRQGRTGVRDTPPTATT